MAEYTNYNVTTGSSANGLAVGAGGLGAEVLVPCSWVNKKASSVEGVATGGYVDVLGAELLLSVPHARYTDWGVDDHGNKILVGGACVQNSFGLAGLEGVSGVLPTGILGTGSLGTGRGAWGASGSWGVLSAEYLVDMVPRRASKVKFVAGLGMVRDLVDRGVAGTGATYEVGTASGGSVGGATGASYCVLISNPAVLGAVASAVEVQKQADQVLMTAAKAASDAAIAAVRAASDAAIAAVRASTAAVSDSAAAAVVKVAEGQVKLSSYAGVTNGLGGSVKAARKALVTGDCGIDPVTGNVKRELLSTLAYSVSLAEAARDAALGGAGAGSFEATLGLVGNSHVAGILYSGGSGVPRVVRLYDQDSGELVGSVFSDTNGGFRFDGVAPGDYFVTSSDLGVKNPTFAVKGVEAK